MIREVLKRWLFGPTTTTLLPQTVGGRPLVTPASALRYTPVYRAVTLISSDIARVDMQVSAPQANTLMANPSPKMSAFEFRRTMTMNVLLHGNAFALINRTMGGELLELILLDPATVTLDTTAGRHVYRVANMANWGPIQPEDMFHLRAPSINGLWGESPVGLCRTSIELLATTEQMAIKAFENAGNPKVALTYPGKLSAEAMQRLELSYMEKHSGSSNAGRPVIAVEGLKVERISSTIDDTGLDSAREFSISDVCRIYGVPGIYLGQAAAGNAQGSLEWAGRQYADSCLSPWLSCWGSEIVHKLGGSGVTVYWDTDFIVKPSVAEHYAALRTGVEAGIITRNEARAQLDLEALPGLDVPTLALNVGTGGGQTNMGDDTSAQEGTPNDF